MDSATVVTGDDVSMFSVPHKESRPATPSQVPLTNQYKDSRPGTPSTINTTTRLPAYTPRGQSPLRTASPLIHQDDYFATPPSRGAYRRDITPGYGQYAAAYPDDPYEMASISQRSYDSRDLSDQTHLLSRQDSNGRGRDPYAYGQGQGYRYQQPRRDTTPSSGRGYQ
jgi:hypothetical protein